MENVKTVSETRIFEVVRPRSYNEGPVVVFSVLFYCSDLSFQLETASLVNSEFIHIRVFVVPLIDDVDGSILQENVEVELFELVFLSEDQLDLVVEGEVLDPLLLSHAEQRNQVPVSHKHERLQETETVKDLAMIFDFLVEDVLEHKSFLGV